MIGPDRDVPPDVRDRITETVWRGIAEGEAQPHRRAPLTVAAGVITLVTAVVVTTLVAHNGGTETVPAAPPTIRLSSGPPRPTEETNPELTNRELDRCAAAATRSGKQAAYPARSAWIAVSRRETPGANVTGVRANGKTFFCLASATMVKLTDPGARFPKIPHTTIRVELVDDATGFVAGSLTDGGAARISLWDVGPHAPFGANGAYVPTENATFIFHVDARPDLTTAVVISRDGTDIRYPLPRPPAPLVVVEDHPR